MIDAPLLFPADPAPDATALVLLPDVDRLPHVGWLGVGTAAPVAADVAALGRSGPDTALLVEHARGSFRVPHLRGHRLRPGAVPVAGHDWSATFRLAATTTDPDRLVFDSRDADAELELRTELEALPGGALRLRHTLTNRGDDPFLLDGLDVGLPLPESAAEVLDLTGRHEGERAPQRHRIADGRWARESRRGRPGLESATMIVAGSEGFGFGAGVVIGLHVGWSGNSTIGVERDPYGPVAIGGGELLRPGEVVLGRDEQYRTPWVYVVAGTVGLDSIAAPLHAWQRSLPAHPGDQPPTINVWEAVYFDHDLDRLRVLADRAWRIGIRRFVLDDGWFTGRRDDTAGLGDWTVDAEVWPDGLHPLVDHVRERGLQFGLWIEPEMVSPNSRLYREHPDWILHADGRVPPPVRNQLVLDLSHPDVFAYLLERLDAVLGEYRVDYVKWDHNRDLHDAGSAATGTPGGHRQTLAYYALLDALRERHPDTAWESCASGGGRIDLGVLERVQRVWPSDQTDALARQSIQRWTTQLVAPEYLGAHVNASPAHQTGRRFPLDFRAGTALFGAFGLELDLTALADDELDRLAEWVARYERWRPLLHGGRTVRLDSPDPAVLMHGVVAPDARQALFAHVQLDESVSNRGVRLRMPGLLAHSEYALRWAGPVDDGHVSQVPPVPADGPTAGRPVRGASLAEPGVWLPRRRPETILLIEATALS